VVDEFALIVGLQLDVIVVVVVEDDVVVFIE
jgi:hypothetical protein